MAPAKVKVQIVGWHEKNHPPGFVECSLFDRFGRDWRISVKFYDATDVDLWSVNDYPLTGSIAGLVLADSQDDMGRKVVDIALDVPLENLSEPGVEKFSVFSDQLI